MQNWQSKLINSGILALGLIGFADTLYLTVKWYTGGSVVCRLTAGCEQVLTSKYASFFGIPLSLVGTVYYIAVIFLLIGFLNHHSVRMLKLGTLLVTSGFIVSLGLVSIQGFIIKAWCGYCLISAITTLLLTILFWINLRKENQSYAI